MSVFSQFLKVCAISGVTLLSTSATSASFTGFAYGDFSNPVSGVNDYINIVNNDLGYHRKDNSVFDWGIDKRGNSSRFRFDGTASDYFEPNFTVTEGTAFSLGEFTYVNRATRYSANVTGIDFDLNVNLLGIGWSTFNYSLSIDNTPNGSKNVPDYVSLISQGEDSSFSYLGNSYRFEILGFSRDGGLTFEDSTFANERSYTTAEIYGQIQAVPVPAALWLFGSGLLTLGALLKRKK
ncbi:MAG: VPLPA-CTERM sorting domain-containing protein [Gammaproteobacteria bacterium]|nr:VPLPA-CTERM sorting domain-containing protein [Gammaproteobacteria bacterium]